VSAEDPKLERIRKLLTKAEGAATVEEADAYNMKASELMARHGVDAAMLAATGAKPDKLAERRISMTDPYSKEKSQLACWVGRALGCRGVQHLGYGSGRTVTSVTLFGFESDLQRAEILFTSLLLQATRQVTAQRPPAWTSESTAAFRRTWLVGFASEVYRRLTSTERAAAEQHPPTASAGPSVALVLANRQSAVTTAFEERFPKLRPGRRRQLSGSGYRAGADAGRRADLGGTRLGGHRRELGRS
jgi:hypothetical protein